MSSIAYALRAEYEEGYLGGVLALGDHSLNVAEELEKGNGVIVVPATDTLTTTVLDHYPPLKRVPVPEDPPEPVDEFDVMTVPQLRDKAAQLGIESPGRTRGEVLAAVRAAVNPDEQEG